MPDIYQFVNTANGLDIYSIILYYLFNHRQQVSQDLITCRGANKGNLACLGRFVLAQSVETQIFYLKYA